MAKTRKLAALLGAGALLFALAGSAFAAKPANTIAVDKQVDKTSLPHAGGVVTYTIKITNTGDQDFHVVSLVDANCDATPTFVSSDPAGTAPGESGAAGFLLAGQSWTFTCTRDLTGQPAGDYTNVATAYGCHDNSDCNQGNHDATADSQTVTTTIAAAVVVATPPNTSELASTTTSGSDLWLAFVALGVALAAVVVLRPARIKVR